MKETVKTIGLGKTYDTGPIKVQALKNVNLSICEGEFVAITGSSGSGKTTLLNMIGGLDTPTTGMVEVSGINLSGLSDEGIIRIEDGKVQ